jgi:hypothetical protein
MGLTTRLAFYLLVLWDTVSRALRAPLTYWERRIQVRRDHELAILDRQLRAQTEVMTAIMGPLQATLEGVSAASQAQQKFLADWLDSFKVIDVPTATVVREDDEVRMAMEREAAYLREHGIPVTITPGNTVEWMLEQVGPEQKLAMHGVDVDALRATLAGN